MFIQKKFQKGQVSIRGQSSVHLPCVMNESRGIWQNLIIEFDFMNSIDYYEGKRYRGSLCLSARGVNFKIQYDLGHKEIICIKFFEEYKNFYY